MTAQERVAASLPLERWTLLYESRIFPIYGDTDHSVVSEHDSAEDAAAARKRQPSVPLGVYVVRPPGWVRPPTREEQRTLNGVAMLRDAAERRAARR